MKHTRVEQQVSGTVLVSCIGKSVEAIMDAGVHALCCEPVSQNAGRHLSGKENLVELGIRVHKLADEVVGIDLGDKEVFGQQGPTHCILQSYTSEHNAC